MIPFLWLLHMETLLFPVIFLLTRVFGKNILIIIINHIYYLIASNPKSWGACWAATRKDQSWLGEKGEKAKKPRNPKNITCIEVSLLAVLRSWLIDT